MKTACLRSLLFLLWLVACHTITEELPTRPQPAPTPDPGALIPVAPAPAPTARPFATPVPGGETSPSPAATPAPSAAPGGGGGASPSCGDPTPPALARIDVGILLQGAGRLVLDATPLVGPDAAYCLAIGYPDGRRYCPVLPEGHPERAACEAMLVGRARDTGRAGPTWSAAGRPCSGPDGSPSCENHPDNQYLVFAYGTGTFGACAASGVCGQLVVR